MTTSLARGFNFCGKRGKHAFKVLMLRDVVCGWYFKFHCITDLMFFCNAQLNFRRNIMMYAMSSSFFSPLAWTGWTDSTLTHHKHILDLNPTLPSPSSHIHSKSSIPTSAYPSCWGHRLSSTSICTVVPKTNIREYYQTIFTLICYGVMLRACVTCLTDCWECVIWLCGGKDTNVINKQVSHY